MNSLELKVEQPKLKSYNFHILFLKIPVKIPVYLQIWPGPGLG